jgi:hypothetical protein
MAHPYLANWFWGEVKKRFPDAHISWSYRDMANQEDCVARGVSRLHFPKSAHNKQPALALDLFQLVDGQAKFNPSFYHAIYEALTKQNRPILWGAVWKSLGDGGPFSTAGG